MKIKSRFLTVALFALVLLELGAATACRTKSELKPSAQGEASAAAKATQSAFQMTLTTDPQEVKDDKQFTVRVKVTDQAGKPVSDAMLHGVLIMKTMDMGKNEFDFAAKGDGTYEATARPDMAGPWEIKLSAKRGADVGEKSFELVVKE
jgi:nitrogen fixation protein FixH